MLFRVTAVRGVDGRPVGGSRYVPGDREASRSLQGGLVGIAFIGSLLATFGPWFDANLAYLMLLAAGIAAILGIRWADRVAHAPASRTSPAGRRDARAGATLSAVALLVVLSYTGILFILLFLWPFALAGFLIAWAVHHDRIAAQASRREART